MQLTHQEQQACKWRFQHYCGISVRSPHGEYLGVLRDFAVTDEGEVAYAILECRDAETRASKRVGFAWSEFSFTFDEDNDSVCLLLCMDRETLDVLPGIDDLPDWNGHAVTEMHPSLEDSTVVIK